MGAKSTKSTHAPLLRHRPASGAQWGDARNFVGTARGDLSRGVQRPDRRRAGAGRGMRCPNCRHSKRVLFRPAAAGMWSKVLESSLRIAALVVANLPANVLSQLGMLAIW
jgi:hypothetical protein